MKFKISVNDSNNELLKYLCDAAENDLEIQEILNYFGSQGIIVSSIFGILCHLHNYIEPDTFWIFIKYDVVFDKVLWDKLSLVEQSIISRLLWIYEVPIDPDVTINWSYIIYRCTIKEQQERLFWEIDRKSFHWRLLMNLAVSHKTYSFVLDKIIETNCLENSGIVLENVRVMRALEYCVKIGIYKLTRYEMHFLMEIVEVEIIEYLLRVFGVGPFGNIYYDYRMHGTDNRLRVSKAFIRAGEFNYSMLYDINDINFYADYYMPGLEKYVPGCDLLYYARKKMGSDLRASIMKKWPSDLLVICSGQ